MDYFMLLIIIFNNQYTLYIKTVIFIYNLLYILNCMFENFNNLKFSKFSFIVYSLGLLSFLMLISSVSAIDLSDKNGNNNLCDFNLNLLYSDLEEESDDDNSSMYIRSLSKFIPSSELNEEVHNRQRMRRIDDDFKSANTYLDKI